MVSIAKCNNTIVTSFDDNCMRAYQITANHNYSMLISTTLNTSIVCLVSLIHWGFFTGYSTKQKKCPLWSNRGFYLPDGSLILFQMYEIALMTATNKKIAYNFCFFAFCLIVLTISMAIFWCSFVCECKSKPSTVSQSTLHIRHHPMLEAFLLLKLSNNLISPWKIW